VKRLEQRVNFFKVHLQKVLLKDLHDGQRELEDECASLHKNVVPYSDA
jgi:hypothetical protein